jgi:hypothetical protein
MAITHIIYHLVGHKVGCTDNLDRRMREYPRQLAQTTQILEILYDASDQAAGDREQWYCDQFGYRRYPHYAHCVTAVTQEQRVTGGRRSAEVRGYERSAEVGRKVGRLRGRCPYCGREINLGNLARYHGDRCRQKPSRPAEKISRPAYKFRPEIQWLVHRPGRVGRPGGLEGVV